MLDTNSTCDAIFSQNQNLGSFNNSNFDPISSTANQNLGSASPLNLDLGSVGITNETDDRLVFRGTGDSDILTGTNGNDRLYGLAGDDRIFGCGGDDLLKGTAGKDLLIGGQGNDTLRDDDGSDILFGGEGSDQFWLGSWDAPKTATNIADFEVGTDKIKIGRLGETFDKLTIQGSDRGSIISDRGNVLAIIAGVNAIELNSDSFLFGDPQLAEQLQNDLDTSLKESGAPGATNAIVTPEGFVWKGAAGFSNLEQQTPMQSDDIFSIASTTKAFTGATVLKTVEQGQISLDDTLGQWLPEIASNIPDGETITLRQLLNGSSGILSFDDTPEYISDLVSGKLTNSTPEELVSYVYNQPRFVPGNRSSETWSYTNTGDILAGLMVEKATGSSFHDVMRSQVLEPLGLEHTSYGGKEQINGNLARSYVDFKESGSTLSYQQLLANLINGETPTLDGIPDDVTEFDVPTIAAYGPAGALFSNAQDVSQFTQALFSGELLSQKSINELVSFVDTGFPNFKYGLGVIAPTEESSTVDPQWLLVGDAIGYTSGTSYFPDRGGATSVALANREYRFEAQRQNSATSIRLASVNSILGETA